MTRRQSSEWHWAGPRGHGLVRAIIAASVATALLVGAGTPASAHPHKSTGSYALGSVMCSLAAVVRFSPPLKRSEGGTSRSRVQASLSGCTTDDPSADITGGTLTGYFSSSPLDCATLSQTNGTVTGTIDWRGSVGGFPGVHFTKITQGVVVNDSSSFTPGAASVALRVPSTLISMCASRKGLRSANVTGTLRISPRCGPGGGPVTIFPLDPPGPFCGGTYGPNSITSGPDGALWFTAFNTIGRITTSGTSTIYPVSNLFAPQDITSGPDGALWFTALGAGTNPGYIGRITTSGVVSTFTGSGIYGPSGIVSGPDGALWFGQIGSVGRITTSGAVTTFTVPGSGPSVSPSVSNITVGPDGALWFTVMGHYTRSGPLKWVNGYIGRITTAGVITTYSFAPGLTPESMISPDIVSFPQDITAGPDGALWFTVWVVNNNAPFHVYHTGGYIGRISTSGQVSSYSSPDINGAWGISSGPDGALWFGNYDYPYLGATSGSIGRIDTSGTVTTYLEPGVDVPSDITAGPDGALWFVNRGNDTIGRIAPP